MGRLQCTVAHWCPSRHFAAKQRFGRFRREADIDWLAKPAGSVANDPLAEVSWAILACTRASEQKIFQRALHGRRTR
jgi:hypothetical protein